MNYQKGFPVKPGEKIRLKDFDPQFAARHEKKESALRKSEKLQQRMDELQFQLYAENKRSLLICLQGPDAGGKDGVVRHVIGSMNPQGCRARLHDIYRMEKSATLRGSYLGDSMLIHADMDGVDLSRAHLQHANLSSASLSGANLTNADMSDADLTAADLREAELTGASMPFATLKGAIFEPNSLPKLKGILSAMNLELLTYNSDPALPTRSAIISQYFLLIVDAGHESMDAAWFSRNRIARHERLPCSLVIGTVPADCADRAAICDGRS